jgi:hypothetical protein
MHVSFKIHYRNNLIDKKRSYLIPRSPSWDDRNCSYGHQLPVTIYLLDVFFLKKKICGEILKKQNKFT